MMNRSHIEHTIVAVWLQCIPGMIWGDWIIGAVLAAGWFWSREHAQNEYKIIQARKGKRTPYDPLLALDVRKWSLDSILDAVVPTAATVAMWGLMTWA
jgi:hypothetical protein